MCVCWYWEVYTSQSPTVTLHISVIQTRMGLVSRRKMKKCLSSCRQLVAAQFPTWTAVVLQIQCFSSAPSQRQLSIVSGVRSVFPVPHRETGEEKVWTLRRVVWREYRWLRVKAICPTCYSRHQKNLKSLEPDFIISWDNQNEKTLSQSHFDEGLIFPVNYKIIFTFCYFCKQIR